LVIASVCLAGVILIAQDHPAEPHGHPEHQKLLNPVASTPESVAAGGKAFAKVCAICHGATGKGNGRLAGAMRAYGARLSDLTDATWQHGSTDGEIFVVIRDGIGPDFYMDAWQGKIPDEDIWKLVNYLKTLASRR